MVFLDGVCGPFLWCFRDDFYLYNKVSGSFMYSRYFSIKSKHTRIIKNCEFKKGSRD